MNKKEKNRRLKYGALATVITVLGVLLVLAANLVMDKLSEKYVAVYIEHAEGLDECRKMLLLAKTGKKDGCLIEGMGCPGGCVAGAGTNIPIPKATLAVKKSVKDSSKKIPPKELGEIELD